MARSPLQQDPSLDRNVIVATVLIAVVMFVWLWFVSPPPAPSDQAAGGGGDTTAVARDTGRAVPADTAAAPSFAEADTVSQEQEEPVAPEDPALAGAQEGEERVITVETDLYEARFSTKGATPVAFTLKEYEQFDQETPVQLIDTSRSRAGALALAFTTPSSHNVTTRSLYFDVSAPGDTVQVNEEAKSVSFEAQLGEGMLRLTYTFTPGEYEVGLRVEQKNPASYAARNDYEVIWNGGIPYSEGNPQNESQAAGAFAYSGGEIVSVKLTEQNAQEKSLRGDVKWTAVKSKYFTAVVLPQGETLGATLEGNQVSPAGMPSTWENYTTRLLVPTSPDGPDEYKLYLGPMEYYHLADYGVGLYGMVDYGWQFFEWMTRPLAKFLFIPLFTFLSSFIPSYGIVIILLALFVKTLVYPLTKRSYKSMAKMRELQPRMEEIREKHGDDPQKQQEAMMKMYKETGVNPIGGCLPMLLQYPIIIALWQFLPNSIEIRQEGFLWAHDLSAPDVIMDLPFTIPFYGDFVAGFTLLMGLSMVVQMRVQSAGTSNAQAKIFQYVIPLIIFAVFNGLAAGLSLYYLTYNVVTAVQQKIINNQIEAEKDEPGSNGQGSGKAAARKRSKAKA